MSAISIQKSIRENAEELQDFLKDLKNWEKEIKAEDSKLKRKCEEKAKSKHSDITDSKEQKPNNSKNKDIEIGEQVKMNNIKRAEELKEQGNKFYTSEKIDEAIGSYTEGISLDPSNHLLFANRAMAYIKAEKYSDAVEDCNKSLSLEKNYIKAYLRRAMAYSNLHNYSSAIKDYKKILTLEPWNKVAKTELEKLKPKINTKETSHDKKKSVNENLDKNYMNGSINKMAMEEQLADRISEILDSQTSGEDSGVQEMDSLLDLKIPSSSADIIKPRGSKVTKDPLREVSPVRITKQEKPKEPPPPPRTSHQFYLDWKKVEKYSDIAEAYLLSIPSSFFNGIEMDVDQMVEVVHYLNNKGIESHVAVELLQSLMQSRGFYLNLAFLETEQRREFENVIKKIEDSGCMTDDIRKMKKALLS